MRFRYFSKSRAETVLKTHLAYKEYDNSMSKKKKDRLVLVGSCPCKFGMTMHV